ncbi:hypothetical protein QL093DRAFT_2453366, partial [Fusarium oxysporum]
MESTKINARRVWSSIVRHAKEHHESVNAAVVAYYPQPSPAFTLAASLRHPLSCHPHDTRLRSLS